MPSLSSPAQATAEDASRPAALMGEHSEPSREPVTPAGLHLYEPLLERLQAAAPVLDRRSALVDQALEVWARPGFETFICQPRLRFEPFPYQFEAAARVLRHMQGRAILADEGGLGKTIEAGVGVSELRLPSCRARPS